MADTSRRGFASMSQEKQREIASKGGQAAHAKGTAHEFTPEEAREAGRKGGRAISKDRVHMAQIGRKGGKKAGNSQSVNGKNGHTPQTNGPQSYSSSLPSATALLTADHEKVEKLFHQYELMNQQDFQGKEAIVEEVRTEFEVHAKIEEEIFYPALRATESEEGKDLVDEGIHEHNAARDSLQALQDLSPEDAEYDETFQQFMQCVRHHVEEEKNEMFPLAERRLGDEANKRLGGTLQQRKQQLAAFGASRPATGRRTFRQDESETYAHQ